MSVELLGATDGRIDYGDIAALAGKTGLTVAFTLKPDNNTDVLRLVSQWGNTAATEQCFLVAAGAARRPGLVVYAGGNYFGRFCDNNVLTAGALSRLLFTWEAGAPDVIHIWVDGVDQPISEWIGSDNVAGLLNSVRSVQLGRETDEAVDGVDGDYAEFAIWGEVVPDWFAEAYTTHGLSPRFWRSNGILYAPLVNASSLLDEWGGVVGSATAASDALHPRMFYPGVSPVWQPPPPPYVPAVTFGNHPAEDVVRVDGASGAPTHVAPIDSLYIDEDTDVIYRSLGGGSWAKVGAGDHGDLDGLTDAADHAWALLIDGSRPLTGNWTTGAFDIGNYDNTIKTEKVEIDDALYALDIVAGNPRTNYDTNDYAEYNRASNYYEWVIGSVQQMLMGDLGGAGVFGGSAHQMHFPMVADQDILIDGATNPRDIDTGVMRFEQIPNIPDTRCLTLNVDANSEPGTHAVVVNLTATQIAAGESISAYDVNLIGANSTGGVMRAFEVSIAGNSIEAHALHVDPNVIPLTHHSGSFVNVESAWENALDVTAAFNAAGVDVELFSVNGDVVTIGMDAQFDNIEVILDTAASGAGIKPTFDYSTGGPGWTTFTPSDETIGFRQDGIISWNSGDLAGWATQVDNGVNKYWIRITRTQVGLTTPPIEDTIQVQAITEYGWDAVGDVTIRAIEINGDLNHDGSNIGFFGTAPVAQAAAYTPANVGADRSYDADATSVDELADVLGTLIADLQAYGLLQ